MCRVERFFTMWTFSGLRTTLMLLGVSAVVACGTAEDGVLINIGGGGGAASDSSLTSIDIGLPDRTGLKTQVADIETKMNGYRLQVTSTGAGCTTIDGVKPYATKPIATSLKQGCDHSLTLSLGNMSAGDTQTESPPPTDNKVTYEKDIKPLVDANCATSGCHNGSSALSDQRSFAGLKAVASGAVTR